jgi:methylamine dehydrogenase heavy chain
MTSSRPARRGIAGLASLPGHRSGRLSGGHRPGGRSAAGAANHHPARPRRKPAHLPRRHGPGPYRGWPVARDRRPPDALPERHEHGFAGQIALARPASSTWPAPTTRACTAAAQRRGRGLWHRRPGVAARDRDPAQARPGHEHPRQPATSADGRWLLVQNATPASSVTVVDLKNRRTAAELPTPGCWGVIPWPQDASRFSTVCGDGSLATLALDEAGQARRAAPCPSSTPTPTRSSCTTSAWATNCCSSRTAGSCTGCARSPRCRCCRLLAADGGRAPGAGARRHAAVHRRRRAPALFVGMHPKARDGSHKEPAQQIWVFDLARRHAWRAGPASMPSR